MNKGQRPSRHVRIIKTKEGRRATLINKNVRKRSCAPKKVRKYFKKPDSKKNVDAPFVSSELNIDMLMDVDPELFMMEQEAKRNKPAEPFKFEVIDLIPSEDQDISGLDDEEVSDIDKNVKSDFYWAMNKKGFTGSEEAQRTVLERFNEMYDPQTDDPEEVLVKAHAQLRDEAKTKYSPTGKEFAKRDAFAGFSVSESQDASKKAKMLSALRDAEAKKSSASYLAGVAGVNKKILDDFYKRVEEDKLDKQEIGDVAFSRIKMLGQKALGDPKEFDKLSPEEQTLRLAKAAERDEARNPAYQRKMSLIDSFVNKSSLTDREQELLLSGEVPSSLKGKFTRFVNDYNKKLPEGKQEFKFIESDSDWLEVAELGKKYKEEKDAIFDKATFVPVKKGKKGKELLGISPLLSDPTTKRFDFFDPAKVGPQVLSKDKLREAIKEPRKEYKSIPEMLKGEKALLKKLGDQESPSIRRISDATDSLIKRIDFSKDLVDRSEKLREDARVRSPSSKDSAFKLWYKTLPEESKRSPFLTIEWDRFKEESKSQKSKGYKGPLVFDATVLPKKVFPLDKAEEIKKLYKEESRLVEQKEKRGEEIDKIAVNIRDITKDVYANLDQASKLKILQLETERRKKEKEKGIKIPTKDIMLTSAEYALLKKFKRK